MITDMKILLYFLKEINEISKYGRIVLKLALGKNAVYDKNSIITLMRLNKRTWNQTINNRGDIIFPNI